MYSRCPTYKLELEFRIRSQRGSYAITIGSVFSCASFHHQSCRRAPYKSTWLSYTPLNGMFLVFVMALGKAIVDLVCPRIHWSHFACGTR